MCHGPSQAGSLHHARHNSPGPNNCCIDHEPAKATSTGPWLPPQWSASKPTGSGTNLGSRCQSFALCKDVQNGALKRETYLGLGLLHRRKGQARAGTLFLGRGGLGLVQFLGALFPITHSQPPAPDAACLRSPGSKREHNRRLCGHAYPQRQGKSPTLHHFAAGWLSRHPVCV